MKRLAVTLALAVILLVLATPVYAQAPEGGAASHAQWVVISAGFGMAIASSACGYAQAKAAAAACEGLARNPGATAAIRFSLILSLVLIESLALYTFAIIFVKVK